MSKRRHSFAGGRSKTGGFTIVELMIAAVISSLLLAAVLSAFLFLARGSVRLGQYSDMEGTARRALQQFSQDARQASAANWTSASTLQLTVREQTVVYSYSNSAKTFSRRVDAAEPVVLASDIASFSFSAYQMTGVEIPLSASLAAASSAVKMIQINLELSRDTKTLGKTTSQVISARCVLRNKKVS